MTRAAMTVADLVEAAARGTIGHSEAMQRLGLTSYNELAETMRLNGRSLWAHRPSSTAPDERTLTILRAACEPPKPGG